MEPVRDYELRAFFTRVVEVLEQLGIPYMVVGGFAAIFYGEPRLTLDVDIVVDMKEEHIEPFVATFPVPDYYVSEEGIRDSLRRHYPFDVIQPATGAKIDMMPLTTDPFTLGAFERRQRITYDEASHTATSISAKDLVLSKLSAFQETGSEGHLRDGRGVLIIRGEMLDVEAMRRRAQAAGILELLERTMETATCEIGD